MKARDMARILGRRGGRARARRLTAAERRRIASLGGRARARSLELAQRIIVNFRYADAVVELRGGAPEVKPMRRFGGPLPGIYRGVA
jgi:hypothetical protein